MRVLRIPVGASHPGEPGREVTLRLRHQLPGKSLKIRQLGRVVRRYDEPEMMPVALAPRCEGTMVGVIPLVIEHATSGPVFGYALTPQIGQMSTERSSAHPVPHHARLYNHSGCAIGQARGRETRGPSTSEVASSCSSPCMHQSAGLLRRSAVLCDEWPGPASTLR